MEQAWHCSYRGRSVVAELRAVAHGANFLFCMGLVLFAFKNRSQAGPEDQVLLEGEVSTVQREDK